MSDTVNRFNSDSDRVEIEGFFTAHIDDENRFPLHARATDPLKGYPSFILAIGDGNELVGALHAGAAAEQIAAYVRHGLPSWAVEQGIKDHAMLYSLAVRPDRRHTGIARELVAELLNHLSSYRFQTLYGVTGPESAGFYHSGGFTVLPPGKAIQLDFGKAQVNIPLVGEDSWFYKNLPF
ncbi:GNAT family N-acetyltransferase [Pseudarthrobacter raffinosi]|uniref:GNAT family N-acetyltransferase n=1 Tax=Pseudarthrobacter raffinosi TaxID=2953651 RepID=UPI00208EEEA5|nr:GNAT family N-acetyltransferase [Pseudarthrobacter sp. MDT3-9]MCO4253624.1 GNAT family N-acetyltransferase [Pseudarthrobacter sp. MDT3-9]